MREEVLTDQLWKRLEPPLPLHPRRFRYPGRKRADDRAALEGILYVIRTGIGWNRLPTALFGAAGALCWRRLAARQISGTGWIAMIQRFLARVVLRWPRAAVVGRFSGPQPCGLAQGVWRRRTSTRMSGMAAEIR
ncbi:transposase [Amycolatopsis sp. cmx-4-61]|uniref:transposase n=1 Tax=Amycolatopsis sp. cmx-4-61 TaxID=2790937 RepID=UPI00397A9578